ncbi:hypothetical protein B0H10DRAFT_63470 [Mycena sp. CBHHK59/15]|nr:hypothetical protein B0H10DRAFT_63470 [Mycena sp. CBHHK59/15]
MLLAIRTITFLGRIQSHRIPSFTRGAATPAASRNGHKLFISYEESQERGKSKELIASIEMFLKLARNEPQARTGLNRLIHRKLRGPHLQIPSRSKIMENIISFLVDRHLFEEAVSVYNTILAEGMLPSPSTDALFLAVALVASRAPEASQIKEFKKILSYPSFTESHFLELLDHIVRLNIPPVHAAKLTRLFVSVKGGDYHPSAHIINKLIELQTSAGLLEAVADTIREYEFNDGQTTTFSSPAQPYVTALSAIPASDEAAMDWIMGVMTEKDVPVNITVFNALIRKEVEVSWRFPKKVFAYYEIIMRLATTTSLKPDAETYKNMFRLTGRIYKPNYRPNASRLGKARTTIVPPRELFADMVALYFSVKFHPPASRNLFVRRNQIKADESLLNVALRTFLCCGDWAGAAVVLQAFSSLGVDVTVRTYSTLMRHIAGKIYHDSHAARLRVGAQLARGRHTDAAVALGFAKTERKRAARGNKPTEIADARRKVARARTRVARESARTAARKQEMRSVPALHRGLLAYTLLGDFDNEILDRSRDGDDAWDAAFAWLVGRLLEHNGNGETPGEAMARGGERLLVPTYDMIFRQAPVPSRVRLDCAPLERIVSRAASVGLALNFSPRATETAGNARVQEDIVAARTEMLPDGVVLWTWPRSKRDTR